MEENIFGGFTAVAQSISDKLDPIDNKEEDGGLPGPDDIERHLGRSKEVTTIDDEEEAGDPIPLKEEEEEEEEKDVIVKKDKDDEDVDPNLGTEFGEVEPEMAVYLQEKLYEGFGFEKGEDTEDFKSIDDVLDFVKNVVEENSTPQYPNEELASLDKYVKDGGDIQHYLKNVKGNLALSNLNLDVEKDQKRVLEEHLKTKGYTETKIERALNRYEDAGVLKEEAEDALEMLEEYREEMSEKLLVDQAKHKEYVVKEQQKYVEGVKHEIEDLKDIRGISLSKQEKNQLFNYIFRPTKSGRTQYQEEYIKTQLNMIESAFFTMKGDALVQKVQKKATSEATSKLREKLANKGNRGRNQSGQGGNTVSNIWDSASSQLRSPF